MAETKQNTAKAPEERVRIMLKRNTKPGAPQEEFYSFNFKNYLVKRGEWAEVPQGVADTIAENEALEIEAAHYSDEQQAKASK